MPTLLTCPLGHRWELPTASGATAESFFLCPVCGAVEANRYDPDATAYESTTPRMATAPSMVPGYDLLGELGRGGMGVVYKAQHLKLKRLVALKMILAGAHAGPKELDRFHAEAEAVARLQHPNIVQIHEVGEHEGLPFLSLEYVDGGNLSQRLKGDPFPPEQAAELIETLARAMDYAHRQGVVHRDLKPANVLLSAERGARNAERKTEDSALRAPKIADFGLAKRLDHDSGQTRTGAVVGTAAYMAPEQAGGKTKEVGLAVDIWALGAMLYELLTGRAPFEGETPLDTLLQVMGAEVIPPRRLVPKLPRDLETICLKCLEKLPHRRYASAGQLADDLDCFRRGRPISARQLSVVSRAVRLARHRRETMTLAVIVLIVLMALGAWLLWQRRAAETPARRAERLAPRAQEILHHYCYDCHGRDPAKTDGKLDVLDFAQLRDDKRRIVVPSQPDESKLYHRIVDESMPPPESEEHPRLSAEETTVLKHWIEGGAPPFPERALADPPEPSVEQRLLATDARKVFQEYCWSCHKYGKADGGVKIFNLDLLLTKRKLVVPGHAEQSRLYQLMVGTEDSRMPPEGEKQPSEANVAAVKRWIDAGAPAWPWGR